MKLDGLKFFNTAQRIVFRGNDVGQENKVISKDIALPDAEALAEDLTPPHTHNDIGAPVELSPQPGCAVPPFVPYTQLIPWHSGTRNMFSRFFPRYGNYCGPNYSSGRESGSLHWDKAPSDWLDYCCYRHDMGYDTLDQTKLMDADKQFLNCLQKIPESANISTVGRTYQNVYILGLERFLIPYRDILIRKIEQGKRGKETSPEVIVEEVKERNADIDRSS
ncbi:hypothetical protein M758_10G112800 [Ceratodon purpureus]|nr:hypothetical protein M758_10G112800 [Ceratodon purpureus]